MSFCRALLQLLLWKVPHKTSQIKVRFYSPPYAHFYHTTPPAGVPASIILPSSLFDQVPGERQFIGVYFALYGEPALLPVTSSPMMRENVSRSVGTPIVAATVGPGIDFSGLDPPVVITLGLLSLPDNTTVYKEMILFNITLIISGISVTNLGLQQSSLTKNTYRLCMLT